VFTSQPPQFNVPTAPDPHNGNLLTTITATGSGQYQPEAGKCGHGLGAALVLTPHWIEGLTYVRWTGIPSTSKARSSSPIPCRPYSRVRPVRRQACGNIFFGFGASGGATATSEVDGNGVTRTGCWASLRHNQRSFEISWSARPLNVASETHLGSGFPGRLPDRICSATVARLGTCLGNYNDERTITPVGRDPGWRRARWGWIRRSLPDLSSTLRLAVTYSEGPMDGDPSRGASIGSARLVNTWVEGVNVDTHGVPAVALLRSAAVLQLDRRRPAVRRGSDNVCSTHRPPSRTPTPWASTPATRTSTSRSMTVWAVSSVSACASTSRP